MGRANSFYLFFSFFYRPLASIRKHVVMKMFRSSSTQEINSEITHALVLLKLSGQLEKAPREPSCVQSALCFSAGTVKQVTGRASVL